MGSMIHLSVGNQDIDWGKNGRFTDHSPLFELSDVKSVPYWYVKENEIDMDEWTLEAEFKEGFSSPLWKVADRLKLLGFSHTTLPLLYAKHSSHYLLEDEPILSYDSVKYVLQNIDPSLFINEELQVNRKLDKAISDSIATILQLPQNKHSPILELISGEDPNALHPYTLLFLLSENPLAKEIPVYWSFDDVVSNGWVPRSNIVKPLSKDNRFLLVTEGSSDSSIIKKGFSFLKNYLLDFFDFIDMKEGYPFTGTGNLLNFVKGLISIGIQNNVIVIFDNDAEGVAGYNKCMELNIPANMRIIKLPDRNVFRNFKTIGPDGERISDINGKAAAIECYLDLGENPIVRWTSYKSNAQIYQGELAEKDTYKMKFFNLNVVTDSFDFSGITEVLDLIISQAISIKEKEVIDALDYEVDY